MTLCRKYIIGAAETNAWSVKLRPTLHTPLIGPGRWAGDMTVSEHIRELGKVDSELLLPTDILIEQYLLNLNSLTGQSHQHLTWCVRVALAFPDLTPYRGGILIFSSWRHSVILQASFLETPFNHFILYKRTRQSRTSDFTSGPIHWSLKSLTLTQEHIDPSESFIPITKPNDRTRTVLYMCNYILFLPLCNHYPSQIWAAPGDESCPALRAELLRIYDPAEWAAADNTFLPFKVPERCLPCAENIRIVSTPLYCLACWWLFEGMAGMGWAES